MSVLATLPRWVPLVVALGIGLGAGALLFTTDGSSDAQDLADATATKPVSFYADSGDSDDVIVSIGGLTVSGACRDYGGRVDGPYLSVGARTTIDNSTVGVVFTQREGFEPTAYSFGLSDFDRNYGTWDFLGTNPVNTTGTLVFSRPDGGQVTIDFLADRRTAHGECAFSGVATYAPATSTTDTSDGGPTGAGAELDVTYAYLGVSCPTPNSVACDEVGLYISTVQAPAEVVASVAGHEFELERQAGGGRNGGTATYEGVLRSPGLLHRGPLAVDASADDRWLGQGPVHARVELRAVLEGGAVGPATAIDNVPLGAGYG